LPGWPAARDELPARRAGQGAPRIRAAVLRGQDRRRGRAAVRAAGARRDRRRARLPAGLGARSVVPDRLHELLGVPGRVRPGGRAPPLRGSDRARRRRDGVTGRRPGYFLVSTVSESMFTWPIAPIGIVVFTVMRCSSFFWTQYWSAA